MLTRHPTSVKIGDFQTVEKNGKWYVDGGEKGIIEIYTSKKELESNIMTEEDVLIL